MQETWAVHGVYPNMDWTARQQEHRVLGGRRHQAHRRRFGRGAATFRFTSRTRARRWSRRASTVAVAPDEVQSRMARFATVSPDGKQVVFESFGRLWLRNVADGTPRRLTRDEAAAFELFPSWSRDGKRIAFVRWTDGGLGEVHVVAAGGGRSRAVSQQPGHYQRPRFSPDGKSIVVERSTGGRLTSPMWSADPGIYRLPVDGGAAVRLTDEGREPHFVGNEGRIYFTADKSPAKETRAGARARERGCERAGPPRARALQLRQQPRAVADRRVAGVHRELPGLRRSDAARRHDRPFATDESSSAAARQRYRRHVHQLDRRRHAVVDTRPRRFITRKWRSCSRATSREEAHGKVVANLSMTRPADKPRGVVALTGARIVTMNDARQVIENGTIVVRDNRIVAVGASDAVRDSRGCAAARSRGPHGSARHHRCACAWTAGRERPRASTELVDAGASRARRHDGARPVEQRDRDLRCVRVSAHRRDPRAAHLLDRRRRVRRTLGRLRQHRQAGRRTQSHPATQGAGCDLDQELQPAAPRSAPDGDDRCTRGRHAGRVAKAARSTTWT